MKMTTEVRGSAAEIVSVLTEAFEQLATQPSSDAEQAWQRGYPALLARLAKGTPIPRGEAAALLGWPETELEARLSSLPTKVERDAAGGIIGAGLTLRPTQHEFVVGGQRLFTWCALDALIFPALLRQSAQVTSPCAISGQTVSMTVTPDSVCDLNPAEAAVSLVLPKRGADVRQSFCCHVQFLATADAADRYCAAHPGSFVVGVAEAFQIGQQIARRMAADAKAIPRV